MAWLERERLEALLPIAGLGNQLSFHEEVGSTNDVALEWAERQAPHGSVVIAGAQTAGRGQKDRRWITSSGSGLALSVILRSKDLVQDAWLRLHALGALAVVETLSKWQLNAVIKWPNDVLLEGKKVAGVLVDGSWVGAQMEYVVLGIGVNVERDAVLQAQPLDFPTISIGEVLGRQPDWYELIAEILRGIGKWFSLLNERSFLDRWNQNLAYRDKEISVQSQKGHWTGTLMGLDHSGGLLVKRGKEELVLLNTGEIKILPEGVQ